MAAAENKEVISIEQRKKNITSEIVGIMKEKNISKEELKVTYHVVKSIEEMSYLEMEKLMEMIKEKKGA